MIRRPSRLERLHPPQITNEGDRSLYFGRFWMYSALLLLLIGVALDGAIVTAPEHCDPQAMARLDAVAGRVLARG